MMYMVVVVGILFAFFINLVMTPMIIKRAHKKKWYDLPDHRKIHTGLIPRLGGVSIFFSFIVSTLLASGLYYLVKGELIGFFNIRNLPLLIAITLIHLLGLIDDFRSQKALVKLIVQVVAASLVVYYGFTLKAVTIPYLGTFSLGIMAYPLTILWIIGITNAVNLVDGMDGLAGGIGAFATCSMGIIAMLNGNPGAAVLSFALCGAVLAFLVFNLPPAKIFMGDSGSLLLGFVLSVVPLMGLSKAASFGTVIVPVTLLLVPIIDTLAAIFRRIKDKRTIMSPDKEHLHHKLLEIGLSEKKILVLIYSVSLYLSIISVTSEIMPDASNVYVILIVWLGSMFGYGLIHYLNSRKNSQLEQNKAEKKNTA